MGFLFRVFCSLILALGVGFYTARWAIFEVSASQSIANGPWRVNPHVGSSESDPYTRAYVAITAFLALNKSEAIYFFAETDSAGDPLLGSCQYVLTGSSVPARWWTITAYGPDNFLMENAAGRYAVGSGDMRNDGISFSIGKENPGSGLWLPVGDVDTFSLTLRTYNPETRLLENLASAPLPKITKESCS